MIKIRIMMRMYAIGLKYQPHKIVIGKRSVLDLRKVQVRLNIRVKYAMSATKNILSSPSVRTRLVCGVLKQVEISVSGDKNLH
jgi:hypothetical protein